MALLRLVPAGTNFNFVRLRVFAFPLSAIVLIGSIVAAITLGLNFGIDFRGGILMEVRDTRGPAAVDTMRQSIGDLGLGGVSLQRFGPETDVLIRIQRQEGDEAEQIAATRAVAEVLGDDYEVRRTEFVGPTVGAELIRDGTYAVVLSLLAIMAYIWLRFEWQFAICAAFALTHDVIAIIGMFAIDQHEFNLATVAALLTIAGYSINDTVVVFDRVRENLRRYKRAPLIEILNRSINETLSRTVVTSVTTLLALIALAIFGGAVLRDFIFALIFGVVIGTYSSIFVAVPLLMVLKLRPAAGGEDTDAEEAGDKDTARQEG